MCLQCSTKARTIVRNVLPGYVLKRATVDHPEWRKGWYALVTCNDPDFIWEGKPGKQINAIKTGSKIDRDDKEFFHLVEKMEPQFKESPELGYALIKACKKDGYNEKKHGARLMPWLVNHMAEKMKRK